EVEVLDVDLQRERISLGLKQTTEDPWIKLVENYPIGTIVDGKVTKIVPFGAFIELGDNVEGLVHISEMSLKHIDSPAQVVHVGDEVKIKVMEINPERRRISLSMKAAAEELGFEIPIDETVIVEERPAKKKAEKPAAEAAVAEEGSAVEAVAEAQEAPAAEASEEAAVIEAAE
ncbi:MAG: S1 RNA-binding domain-containing protein, partial [Raoultibacter sp.]